MMMYQCCGCDRLFSTQKAVRQHISCSITFKLRPGTRTRTITLTCPPGSGRSAGGPGGARGLVAAAPEAEPKYFHRGMQGLRGPGPGYRIVILSCAGAGAAESPPASAAARPGARAAAAGYAAGGPGDSDYAGGGGPRDWARAESSAGTSHGASGLAGGTAI